MGCVCNKIKKCASTVANKVKSFCKTVFNGIKKVGKTIYRGVKKAVIYTGKLIYRGLVLVGNFICKIAKYIWKNRVKIIEGIAWLVDKVVVIINGISKIVEIKKNIFGSKDKDDDMDTNLNLGKKQKS